VAQTNDFEVLLVLFELLDGEFYEATCEAVRQHWNLPEMLAQSDWFVKLNSLVKLLALLVQLQSQYHEL